MEIGQLLNLLDPFITPALLLGVAAYFVSFFGKIISDQQPFSDDRRLGVELSGILFILGLINWSAIAIIFAFNFAGFSFSHLFRLAIVEICLFWLIIGMFSLIERVYGIKNPIVRLVNSLMDKLNEIKNPVFKKIIINENQDFFKKISELNNEKILTYYSQIPTWLITVIFVYVLTLEFKANDVLWIAVVGASVFTGFIYMALDYSLSRTRLPKVDILFINGIDPILDVILLKINDDSVRIRKGEQPILLQRNLIQRIEFHPIQSSI